jgi:hypothetical protein
MHSHIRLFEEFGIMVLGDVSVMAAPALDHAIL